MTIKQYQKKRQELLNKKLEVEQRLVSTKEGISKAKREFARTGKPADSDWLTSQEAYVRRLGISAQELQRQLGELKAEEKQYNRQQANFDHFIHDVLIEQMTLEEVAAIFSEARRRKRIFDQRYELQDKES